MTQIRADAQLVTQIVTIDVEPGQQDEVLAILKDRANFMATQPGFVSIALHRSLDGRHIVNYVQWVSRELLQAAHHSPEFRKRWPEVSAQTTSAQPVLYEVSHIEEMPSA